jgi:hypothetical protein
LLLIMGVWLVANAVCRYEVAFEVKETFTWIF